MKKVLAGGVVVTAVAVLSAWAAWAPPTGAQGLDVITLVGPGSSIGITVREATQDDADAARLARPAGVVVESIRPGSPAEKAGFRAGDIVVEFDGERIVSVRQFTRIVRESAPRRQIDVVVMRGTSRQTVQVVPEAAGGIASTPRPGDGGGEVRRNLPRDFSFDFDPDAFRFRDLLAPGAPVLGVSVMPLGAQLAEYFGVKNGALVTEVQSGTAAADAGLKAGDVITAIDGRPVTSTAGLRQELRRAQPGESLDIAVTRDRKAIVLKATPPSRDTRSGRRGLPV